MRLKENFILQQLADVWVVLPLGDATIDFTGMLSLNETGAFLWNVLDKGGNRDALADALIAEYGIDRQQAISDVDEYLQQLRDVGCLEDV